MIQRRPSERAMVFLAGGWCCQRLTKPCVVSIFVGSRGANDLGEAFRCESCEYGRDWYLTEHFTNLEGGNSAVLPA